MSERFPSPNKNTLRIGKLFKRLLPGGEKPVVDDSEDYFITHQRARLDALPAGPGLKGYDLDVDLFHSNDMTTMESRAPYFYHTFKNALESYHKTNPDKQPEPNTHDDPFVSFMYSSEVLSSPTRELSEWLGKNTPQNGYFTPEMVAAAISENPDIDFQQQTKDGLDVWKFSDNEGNTLELSRTSDGSRPNVPTEPYLAATYWTEYDFDKKEIVSTPRFRVKGPLNDALMKGLDLHPIRKQQEIEFRVVDAKPAPYFTDTDTSSLESVVAATHVVADLPHSD